jgi:hypothetical protein
MKTHYVYVHKKATTGEIFYVGKGRGNRAYQKDRGRHWKAIVEKHGRTVEIVADNLPEQEAFALEIKLIALYGRKDKGLGSLVNYTDGGDGASGAVRSDAFKARNSALHTGRKRSEETCKNISDSLVGRAAPSEQTRLQMSVARTGKKHSEATKQKMSEAQLKRDKSSFVGRSKVAIVQSESVIFEGTSVAEQWCQENTNPLADKSNIVKCCRGKINYAYGHTWRYATPEETAALKERATSWAALSDLTV